MTRSDSLKSQEVLYFKCTNVIIPKDDTINIFFKLRNYPFDSDLAFFLHKQIPALISSTHLLQAVSISQRHFIFLDNLISVRFYLYPTFPTKFSHSSFRTTWFLTEVPLKTFKSSSCHSLKGLRRADSIIIQAKRNKKQTKSGYCLKNWATI